MSSHTTDERSEEGVVEQRLVRRLRFALGRARWRLRYWSGLPSFTGFGPTGEKLQAGHMDMQYESAAEDALNLAIELEALGESVRVVDIKATAAGRFFNAESPEVLIYPTNKSSSPAESATTSGAAQ